MMSWNIGAILEKIEEVRLRIHFGYSNRKGQFFVHILLTRKLGQSSELSQDIAWKP